MKISETVAGVLAVPVLTRKRIWFAYVVAVLTDSLQLLLGPLGWALVDEGLDVIAMILTSAALGFHFLLLPTFVIEMIPVADMLPTWTACTAAVVVLRRRAQQKDQPSALSVHSPPVLNDRPPLLNPAGDSTREGSAASETGAKARQ